MFRVLRKAVELASTTGSASLSRAGSDHSADRFAGGEAQLSVFAGESSTSTRIPEIDAFPIICLNSSCGRTKTANLSALEYFLRPRGHRRSA